MAVKTGSIKFIEPSRLSHTKWKQLTEGRGLYANIDFLSITEEWIAVVYNDYEAVMPVFPKRKAGISYLHQPGFIQKTDVYSQHTVTEEMVQSILAACRERYPFAEFYLGNAIPPNFYGKQRSNFLVNIAGSSSEIRSRYKTDLKKNLKIAAQYSYEYNKATDPRDIIAAYKRLYGKMLSYRDRDYKQLQTYASSLSNTNKLILREVRLGTEVQAACLCVACDQRIYLLANYTIPAARKKSANHYLLDQLLEEFAGSFKWLDLEGSDNPGIAHFYQNFGGINEPYYFVAWNKLPIPLRWMKPAY